MWKWLIFVGSVLFLLFSFPAACSSPAPDLTPAKLPPPQTPSASSNPVTPITPQQSKEPPKTPAATVEKGWTIYTDKDEGFEITLPSSWKALTREQIEKSGFNTSGGAKFIFYAVDVLATAIAIAEGKPKVLEFISSSSISKVSITQKKSLAQLEEENVRELETASDVVQPIFHKRVELLAGEALKLRYTMKLPNRAETVVFVQYFLIKVNNVYCFTFETLPYLIEKFEPNYDKMANSFRLTEK